MSLTQQQFIDKLLTVNQPKLDNPTLFSTIALLLRGARKWFGFNLSSGEYEMNEPIEKIFLIRLIILQLSGLINYLIFLDQEVRLNLKKISIKKMGCSVHLNTFLQ